jgi:hypothetical protein
MNITGKAITLFLSGAITGVISLVAIDSWASKSKTSLTLTAEKLSECVRVVDIANHSDEPCRALKISDCMGANGFTFIGTGPNSSCSAEAPVHVQFKHIMPGCYVQQSIASRFFRQ